MNKISVKSFITSILLILGMMILAYVLTLVIPAGEYTRTIDTNGNSVVDPNGAFTFVEGGIPFYKWLLSPFLLLGSSDGGTIIAIIAFLFIIGGVSNILNSQGLIEYMVNKTANRFGNKRYIIIAILVFIFMFVGSFCGSFEEIVTMLPLVTSLMVILGFDIYTGLMISLLSISSGFSAGIINPFTVGVAQQLAGVAMFSGIWLRIVSFILIYALLVAYIIFYAKKIAKPVDYQAIEFKQEERKDKAIMAFILIFGIGILAIIGSIFIEALQDISLVVIALMFLIAGIVSSIIVKVSVKEFFKVFLSGILSTAPAVIMILMASSIKYTLVEAKVLDSILYYAIQVASEIPTFLVILFIYLIVLVMNFFIPSGSAKAFLLIPLIVPIANVFGISSNLCILAFAFGDGFSNVVYPTNPVLLISLSIGDVSYTNYFKRIWKFELLNLLLTCIILIFGLLVNY